MILFTDAAAEHIKKVLTQNRKAIGFRLGVKKTGCSGYSYVPEVITSKRAGDKLINTEHGIDVFLDGNYLDKLQGLIVDYVQQGLGAAKLVFQNPNADSACGCGESFNFSKAEHKHEHE